MSYVTYHISSSLNLKLKINTKTVKNKGEWGEYSQSIHLLEIYPS